MKKFPKALNILLLREIILLKLHLLLDIENDSLFSVGCLSRKTILMVFIEFPHYFSCRFK